MSLAQTMQAIAFEAQVLPLEFQQLAVPVPIAGQVLIEIIARGIVEPIYILRMAPNKHLF